MLKPAIDPAAAPFGSDAPCWGGQGTCKEQIPLRATRGQSDTQRGVLSSTKGGKVFSPHYQLKISSRHDLISPHGTENLTIPTGRSRALAPPSEGGFHLVLKWATSDNERQTDQQS